MPKDLVPPLHLTLLRKVYRKDCTIGHLSWTGMPSPIFVLEDVVRPKGAPKVHGQTAIPEGFYRGIVSWSPRFNKFLPEILQVPGFQGIRIHAGNTPEDTMGCLLLGKSTDNMRIVSESRKALAELMEDLALHGNTFTLEVSNDRPPQV